MRFASRLIAFSGGFLASQTLIFHTPVTQGLIVGMLAVGTVYAFIMGLIVDRK